MKTIKYIPLAFMLSVSFLSSAQSFPRFPSGPDFLYSRATASVFANTFDDIRHIVYSGGVNVTTPEYYYIDQGFIDGAMYKYYISRNGSLVMGVPVEFPNNMYVISICAYFPQGGWATREYIQSQQQRCECW
jgi:hypothetical protein